MADNKRPDWDTVESLLRAFLAEHDVQEMSDAIIVWMKPGGQIGHAYHTGSGMGAILSMLEVARFTILHDEVHQNQFMQGMRN